MRNEYADRKHLTFEQAEGVAPLPMQLKLRELSDEPRARLWEVHFTSLQTSITTRVPGRVTPGNARLTDPWYSILRDKHVYRDHRMIDEFSLYCEDTLPDLKRIFLHGDYLTVFGFVQWVLRHRHCPDRLSRAVAAALEQSRAAYRLLDDDTIVPIGSNDELESIERALADVSATEFRGARRHLKNAASELTDGQWSGSIRESVHAVESVARVLDSKSNTLGPALARLEKSIRIHSALRTGFGNLYNYTSDEKGVRHALLNEDSPQVDETDAIYMLGACAAFVSYLINKARRAGLI